MRTRLAVVLVFVSFAAVVHAQTPGIAGPQGLRLYLGNSPVVDPDRANNPLARFGSPYAADSIDNPRGRWVSPYGAVSPTSPFTSRGPRVMQPNQPVMPPGW